MSKQPPSAPTASAIGPCPTIIQNVGRPGTVSLPRTIATPDHPCLPRREKEKRNDSREKKMSKQPPPHQLQAQ